MLNLKLSKETRSEAIRTRYSNDQKSIKHISKLSKSK